MYPARTCRAHPSNERRFPESNLDFSKSRYDCRKQTFFDETHRRSAGPRFGEPRPQPPLERRFAACHNRWVPMTAVPSAARKAACSSAGWRGGLPRVESDPGSRWRGRGRLGHPSSIGSIRRHKNSGCLDHRPAPRRQARTMAVNVRAGMERWPVRSRRVVAQCAGRYWLG